MDIAIELRKLKSCSEQLLNQEEISADELYAYKMQCAKYFVFLINENIINETITEIAQRGLSFKNFEVENPILRWIYYNLFKLRDDIYYNAPYLKGSSKTDLAKQYIFWIDKKLDGIEFNLSPDYSPLSREEEK